VLGLVPSTPASEGKFPSRYKTAAVHLNSIKALKANSRNQSIDLYLTARKKQSTDV